MNYEEEKKDMFRSAVHIVALVIGLLERYEEPFNRRWIWLKSMVLGSGLKVRLT